MSRLVLVRRALLAFVLLASAALPTAARAADAPAGRTIVVVSLVGDEFTVVVRRGQVGTRIDPNELRRVPVSDPMFDRIAMGAAEKAIQKAAPGSNVLQALIRDPRLFEAQDELLADTPQSQGLRTALRELLAQHGASHLLLVTKRRSDASFQLNTHTIGGGTLTGIGFYVDNLTPLINVGSHERSPGFLSPFASLTVSLVDAATMKTVRSEAAKETRMSLTVDSKDAVKAWDALSPDAKVDALERAIASAVGRATTAVIAP